MGGEKTFHRLLDRQLRRFVKPEQMEGLEPFLESINQFYIDAENERKMLERTLDVSSKELEEANRSLRNQYEELVRQEEIKRARDEALDEARRQKEANRAKDVFLSNMSHELRTPLNAIIGFAQILNAKPDTPPQVKTFVEKILISGKNLLELVNTILDFSKISAGKTEVVNETFDLWEMMHEAAVMIEPLSEKKSLSIDCNVPEHVLVFGDRQLLKQVFVNLLGNAVKFSPQNGRIEVFFEKQGEMVLLGIKDQGPGIEPRQIESLFEPFVQVREHQNAAIKGTGLGLSIAKKIIELHGGKIWVESSPGQGSSFFVRIPQVAGTRNG